MKNPVNPVNPVKKTCLKKTVNPVNEAVNLTKTYYDGYTFGSFGVGFGDKKQSGKWVENSYFYAAFVVRNCLRLMLRECRVKDSVSL